MEDCIELVGCIEYHKLVASSTVKDSDAMEAWSNFYTVEVWKRFLRCGSVKGCIELVGYIEYRKGSYAVETRSVVSSWLEALSTINWLHGVP